MQYENTSLTVYCNKTAVFKLLSQLWTLICRTEEMKLRKWSMRFNRSRISIMLNSYVNETDLYCIYKCLNIISFIKWKLNECQYWLNDKLNSKINILWKHNSVINSKLILLLRCQCFISLLDIVPWKH